MILQAGHLVGTSEQNVTHTTTKLEHKNLENRTLQTNICK